MYPISQLFESFMKRRDSQMIVKAEVGNETYDMSNIVDFAINTQLITGEEFEIGTVVASRLVIKMRLKGEVPVNAKIKPYVAFDTTALTWLEAEFGWQDANMPWQGGASEWMPLGEFYIDSRTREDEVWRFECLDKIIWSERPYESSLTYPASMQAVWNEMCSTLGYTYDNTVYINPSYTIASKPVGYTCRQMMGYIAGANSASVRCGKDGQMQFKRFAAVSTPDIDLTASDYIRAKQTNPLKSITKFVVQYDDEQELTFEAGTGDESQTLYYSNPFMTQAMVNDLRATLGGFSYQPMEMDARGYPHLDVGDEIGYEVYEGSTWENAVTPWQDTHIPWDGQVHYRSLILVYSIRYSGGFQMQLDAPAYSDQQSEYAYTGPLTQKVQQLNKEAVKLERNYYGVTTSREEGLVVEVEGGGGRAVLNADELSFWADGERALWFDIPNKRYMFSGDIEGSNIYGSTFRTNRGGYPYVELSSYDNVFIAAKSGSSYIEIEANPTSYTSPIIKHINGEISHFSGIQAGAYFSLVSSGSYDIGATEGAVRINGGSVILNGDPITVATNMRFNGTSNIFFGSTSLNSILSGIYSRLSALENQ